MKMECMNCHFTFEKEELEKKYNNVCPVCHEKDSYIEEYLMDIKRLSQKLGLYDKEFIESMVKLHNDDPIEYQLKISQFKTQIKQQEEATKRAEEDNKPKCPTCGSTNIEKITIGKKAIGGALFGLFSSDVRKSMHCKNCGYKW